MYNTDLLGSNHEYHKKFIPAYKNRSSILLWNVTAVCHESGWCQVKEKAISTRLRYSQTMYAQSRYGLRQKKGNLLHEAAYLI